MAWLFTAGVLALIASTSASVTQGEPAAEATETSGEILTTGTEQYRRMTVPVTVNGAGPFDFLIDTGAQVTVLSHALADQLQLTDRDTATLIGMASRRTVETAMIDEIAFGSHSFYDARAALVEGGNIGGADGILGLDALQDRRVLLDFENGHMEVVHADEQASNRGFEIVVRARRAAGQLIIARAVLDGVHTAVMVDTGAQGSIGNAALLRRLRARAQAGTTQMTDVNGISTSGTMRIGRSLQLGSAQLGNFRITFAPSPTFAAIGLEDEPALILGMDELRLFNRVAIDFASRRVLFDLPRGSRVPSSQRFRFSG